MKRQRIGIWFYISQIKVQIDTEHTALQQGKAVFFYSTFSHSIPPPFPIKHIILYKSVLATWPVCFFFFRAKSVAVFFHSRAPPSNSDFQKIRIGGKTMRYQPKKVFILENGMYQELTYQDYCQNRQNDDSYAERYFIPLQGMLLEVSQDIYAEFYRDKERERYLRKLDRENKLLSLEALKRDGDGTADISLSFSGDIAEKVISDLLLDRLWY